VSDVELDPAIARAFDGLFADLEPIGRDPSTGGYRRFVYGPAESALREWFSAQVAARGLEMHEDRAGNLWGWWGSPTAGNALVTGSHLDSVPQGGAFDGPLGVVSALLAIDVLRARGVTPRRPLAVVAFAEEEGARFGIACAGSRLLTGQLDAERALALRDPDGITLAEALASLGRDPASLGPDPALVASIGTFVELHVEQGRGLVHLDRPVALGTAIRPHGRWRIDLEGRADHAGTTRLVDRQDPMLALAALISDVRAAAERHDALATVGKVVVEPNGVNAIPSRVRAWLDARADDEAAVRATLADLERSVEVVEESWTPRVELDVALRSRLAAVLADAPGLPTGAGHDAGILTSAGVPAAMLYVRNPTGVSHSPLEHAERADCLAGVSALAETLIALAGDEPRPTTPD